MLDFSFDGSEEFDINAFEDIIAFYESKISRSAFELLNQNLSVISIPSNLYAPGSLEA